MRSQFFRTKMLTSKHNARGARGVVVARKELAARWRLCDVGKAVMLE